MTKSKGINKPRIIWTDEMIAELVRRYPHEKTEKIAESLGIDLQRAYQKAARLGLSKTAEYLASPDAQRLRRGDNVGAEYRYPKGHIPANKGLRRPGWAPGRMADTQFKKGRKPEEARNYKPIGSLRITRDGTLERKISDDPNIYPARRWVAVHRLVWQEENGRIPKGHICVFKPGMHTTNPEEITADRIECISYAENMQRNSYHNNYPKEIAELIQLRGAVQRKINRRMKDGND